MAWRTRPYAELNRPVAELVGDKTAKGFAALRIATVGDLLRHAPRRYLAGTQLSDLSSLVVGQEVAVIAKVRNRRIAGYGAKQRLEVDVTDGVGDLRLTFFGNSRLVAYWDAELGKGSRGIFVGKVGQFRQQLQLSHPDFVMLDARNQVVGRGKKDALASSVFDQRYVGLYPATAKLPTWAIHACVDMALERVEGLGEPLPGWVLERAGVLPLAEAFRLLHRPDDLATDPARAHERLVFDEALGTQLTMALRRRRAAADPATARPRRSGGILDAFDARLPFALTAGQREVSEEIFTDLASTHPMQRLLQGEVGSGKTIVALRAMLAVVDAGGQAALLAPTEVLAAQHARTLRGLLGDLAEGGTLAAAEHATQVALLTGSATAAARREALAAISSGEAGIAVGTHALLGQAVEFRDLGFVVVDEQHRFGVEQRAAMTAKASSRTHVLVMTATPIPRSVAMTVFGDLAVSSLHELPAGRSEVTTTVVDTREHPAWVDRAWTRVREEVAKGRQAFVVAPRIEPGDASEESLPVDPDADDAAPLFPTGVAELSGYLADGPLQGLRVGMLHGQLPNDVKDATMRAFAAGEIDVLVATTVVEVGVDVPNASMMIIVEADRFGISQLHQLRGRIGRGAHAGVCLLLTSALWGTPARERLDAVAASRDGFELAEADLEQRREGDVLGLAQAGRRSSLRYLSVLTDVEQILTARDIAEQALREDPALAEPGLADLVEQTERLAADEAWAESAG